MQAARARHCAARSAAPPRASAAKSGTPRADALRAAPSRLNARSPLRRTRGHDETAAAALPPRRASSVVTEEAPLPNFSELTAPAPGSAAELRRRQEAPDAARQRLEERWAQPSAAGPAGLSLSGRPETAIATRNAAALAPHAAAATADDLDGSTVRRAPLNVRGQRLHATRTLAQLRALSRSRATSRRACADLRRPTQRLHAVRAPAAPRCLSRRRAEQPARVCARRTGGQSLSARSC